MARSVSGQQMPTHNGANAPSLIMVVDDSADECAFLVETLQDSVSQVVCFNDARSAVEEMRSGIRPDLVITDLCMPGMDGLDLVAALKPILPNVPVIMLTAHGGVDTYFKAFSLGIFDYVNKPVDHVTMRRIVKAAIATVRRARQRLEQGKSGDGSSHGSH